jgi:hypothetical protein
MLTAAFGDLPSVDASGQLDVRDENVGGLPPVPRQRIRAIGRVDDVESFLSQSLHHELADEGVVLDEEYSHRRLLNFLLQSVLSTADTLPGERQNPE